MRDTYYLNIFSFNPLSLESNFVKLSSCHGQLKRLVRSHGTRLISHLTDNCRISGRTMLQSLVCRVGGTQRPALGQAPAPPAWPQCLPSTTCTTLRSTSTSPRLPPPSTRSAPRTITSTASGLTRWGIIKGMQGIVCVDRSPAWWQFSWY